MSQASSGDEPMTLIHNNLKQTEKGAFKKTPYVRKKKTEIKKIAQVIAKMMIQARACEALNGFAFDVMIFSCASIDSTSTYESTDDVAAFKFVSKRYGKKKILIVDSSKFDKSNPCRSFFLNNFDLILTDASHEIVDPIKEQGANIITSSEK